MQPDFPRLNEALRFTLQYYEIERIRDYMFYLAGDTNKKYLLDYKRITFRYQELMENEINQNIFLSNHNAHVALFGELKEWLTDVRISALNINWVKDLIDKYNTETHKEFEAEIEKEVEKFQQNPNFYRANGEEYEVLHSGKLPFFNVVSIPYTTKEINRRYYCILSKALLIDTAYLKDYLELVNEIITNFRRIVTKYVDRYDAGLIKAFDATFVISQLPRPNPPLIDQPGTELPQKLKVNLTVKQIASLFKILQQLELIPAGTENTEMAAFIKASFSTKQSTDISLKSLINHFASLDFDALDFWVKTGKDIGLQANILKQK